MAGFGRFLLRRLLGIIVLVWATTLTGLAVPTFLLALLLLAPASWLVEDDRAAMQPLGFTHIVLPGRIP